MLFDSVISGFCKYKCFKIHFEVPLMIKKTVFIVPHIQPVDFESISQPH